MSKRTRAANGRSSIVLERDGKWHGYVTMGKDASGKTVRKHCVSKTKAETTRKVRALEKQRDSGGYIATGRPPTVQAYLESWIERRTYAVRPNTVAGYRADLRHVARNIGHVRIDRLTPSDVDRLWSAMVEAGVLGSVAHVRRTLNACLVDAVNDGYLQVNPVGRSRIPKHIPPPINPYTVSETQHFLKAAQSSRNTPRWWLGVIVGLRQGEVLGLQWDDLDLEDGTLKVRRQVQRRPWMHGCQSTPCGRRPASCPSKHGGGLHTSEPKSEAGRRTVHLPANIVESLRTHRFAQAAEFAGVGLEPPTWVFADPRGKAIDKRRDWQEYRDIASGAGLRIIRLHDLRHTAGTLMLETETDLKTSGSVLGHSSIAQTARYTHVLSDRQSAAAARMDAMIWPAHDTTSTERAS